MRGWTDDEARVNASAGVSRTSRVPGTVEWCYQTADMLKLNWQAHELDSQRVLKYTTELRAHKAWLKIPAHKPYGSEKAMLKAELGIDEPIEKVIGRRIEHQETIAARRKAVRKLADDGLSQRQIAKELNISVGTVNDDLCSEKSVYTPKTERPARKVKQYKISEYTKPATAAAKIIEKFGLAYANDLAAAIHTRGKP